MEENNIQDIEYVEVVEEPTTFYTYIKKEIPGYYFRPSEPLTEDNCDILGSTFEDFKNGKFVPLNEEQITFAEEHPNATIKEIFNMQILEPVVPVRTIEMARMQKKRDISAYDNSPSVNDFTINNELHAWFTPTERNNYRQSVESAKLLNIENLQFFVGNQLLTVSTNQADMMLAMLQLYADQCFIVTKQHQLAIDQLETIEEVDDYDYTVGYPNKINFEL